MNKLLSVIVAVMFAASSAFVASPVGAQTKDEPKKTQKKGEGKKKAEGKKADGDKKEPKKTQKKGEGKKKDEKK